MLMATDAMRMAVFFLFIGSGAHIGDIDGIVQRFAGEWMVAVDVDGEFPNLHDGDQHCAILRLQLHSLTGAQFASVF